MNRVEQKRIARHARSKAARHDRFVSLYVRKKNKEVYQEAEKFYQQLDQKYPTKRDLTITDEFVQSTTEYTSAFQSAQAKYYARKKQKSDTQQVKAIALEIPLMNESDVDIAVMNEKVDESLCIPQYIYNDLLTEISKDPAMTAIFNDTCKEQPEEQQELTKILDELDDILPNKSTLLEQELENLVSQ